MTIKKNKYFYRLDKKYAGCKSTILNFFKAHFSAKVVLLDNKLNLKGNDFVLKIDENMKVAAEIKSHKESISCYRNWIFYHKNQNAGKLIPEIELEKDTLIKGFMVLLHYQFRKNIEALNLKQGWLIQESCNYIDYKIVMLRASKNLNFTIQIQKELNNFIFFEIGF